MVETLHQPGDPRQAGLDPDDGQAGETFGQSVHDPVGHVDDIAPDKGQSVHRPKAVDLHHEGVLPVIPGMETKRQAAFFEGAIDLHVVIVMNRLVANRRHHKPDATGRVSEFLDGFQRRFRIVERQEHHGF